MCLLDASVDTGLELALAGQAPTPQGCLAAGRGLRTEVQRGHHCTHSAACSLTLRSFLHSAPSGSPGLSQHTVPSHLIYSGSQDC